MIRVGSKVPLHIYDDSLPNDAEHHWQEIAVCHTAEEAARIARMLNAQLVYEAISRLDDRRRRVNAGND